MRLDSCKSTLLLVLSLVVQHPPWMYDLALCLCLNRFSHGTANTALRIVKTLFSRIHLLHRRIFARHKLYLDLDKDEPRSHFVEFPCRAPWSVHFFLHDGESARILHRTGNFDLPHRLQALDSLRRIAAVDFSSFSFQDLNNDYKHFFLKQRPSPTSLPPLVARVRRPALRRANGPSGWPRSAFKL